jgi:hypothetical protein
VPGEIFNSFLTSLLFSHCLLCPCPGWTMALISVSSSLLNCFKSSLVINSIAVILVNVLQLKIFYPLPVQAMVWLFQELDEGLVILLERTKVNICFDKIKYQQNILVSLNYH